MLYEWVSMGYWRLLIVDFKIKHSTTQVLYKRPTQFLYMTIRLVLCYFLEKCIRKTELIVQYRNIRKHVDCTCCTHLYVHTYVHKTERTKKKGWKCLKLWGVRWVHTFLKGMLDGDSFLYHHYDDVKNMMRGRLRLEWGLVWMWGSELVFMYNIYRKQKRVWWII